MHLTQHWDIDAAWDAASAVCAVAFDVPVDLITAPSRGRGPRPPAGVWMAKKMAVHIAVVIADCGYKALGDRIGLHKDTVASHCADVRTETVETDRGELLSTVLEFLARSRLQNIAQHQVESLRAQLAMLEATVSELGQIGGDAAPVIGVIRPSSDRHPPFHPTAQKNISAVAGNLIALPAAAKARA